MHFDKLIMMGETRRKGQCLIIKIEEKEGEGGGGEGEGGGRGRKEGRER
jgi:hypothetical protein